jgi:hypothetical protein
MSADQKFKSRAAWMEILNDLSGVRMSDELSDLIALATLPVAVTLPARGWALVLGYLQVKPGQPRPYPEAETLAAIEAITKQTAPQLQEAIAILQSAVEQRVKAIASAPAVPATAPVEAPAALPEPAPAADEAPAVLH